MCKKTDVSVALTDYTDSEQITPELRSDVAAARKSGLILGYPDGSFRPAEVVRFDELAQFLTRNAYLHGNGSQIIKGRIMAVNQRNLLISETGSGKNEWYYLNQWASITDLGKNIDLEEAVVGRTALLMLHDNREISNLELLEDSDAQIIENPKKDQGWRDVADYLIFTTDTPNNVEQFTHPPFAFYYHNLFPFQGAKSVAFDGKVFWVYAPYHRQIFLFDTQGIHRETLEVPEWLKIDTLANDNQSILAFNQSLNEWYRLRPIYYTLPTSNPTEGVKSGENPTDKLVSSTSLVQPADPGTDGGPGRFCLLYCGGIGNQVLNRYTSKELLPLVAYVDTEGNIKKPFFNSFVMFSQYSPLLNGRPLGRDLPQMGGGPAETEDWKAVFDEYFAENRNLDALEESVGELVKAVGRDDYQVEVYLGIPTPQPRVSAWQELGTGGLPIERNEFKVPEVYAVWWSMRGLYDRFQKQGYKHLKLAGFYYQSEQGYPGDKVQESFPLLCRYLGLRSIAIPGVTSSYPLNFKKNGFDTLMIQSSHVFIEPPPQRYPQIFLDEASIIAREGKTGFLIELPYEVRTESARARLYETIRTLRTLPASIPIGCFQGFDYLSQLSRSENDLRLVYDSIYHAVSQEY